LLRCCTPGDVSEAREVGEADSQVEGNHGFTTRFERQAKRERRGRGTRAFQPQRAVQGGQRQSKRIRIADLRPHPDRRATERPACRRALESNLGRLIAHLFKSRRLNELPQALERCAGA
jgi:hypothetical protein